MIKRNKRTFIQIICIPFFWVLANSCLDTIVRGTKLSNEDIKYIQSLGLLDKDETIDLIYYTLSPRTTGNFITSKRIASYLDYKDNPNRHKDFAYYSQVDTLYSDFRDELGYGNRIMVKKMDGQTFYLNVNGSQKMMADFLNRATKYWKESKK